MRILLNYVWTCEQNMNATLSPDDGQETYNVAFAIFSVVAPAIFILVIIMLLMFFVAHILR